MSNQLNVARLAVMSLGKKDRAALMQEFGPSTCKNTDDKRLVRRKEAARLLSCCVRTVENYAKEGIIRRVTVPGRKRAYGYRLEDICKLIDDVPPVAVIPESNVRGLQTLAGGGGEAA